MGAPDADLESYSPCLWVDIKRLILFPVRVMDDNDAMAFWLSYWNIQVLNLTGDPQSLPISSVGHGLGLGSGQPRPWQSLPKLQLVVSVRHWWRVWTRGPVLPWRHPVTNINVSPDLQILSNHPPVRNEPATNWRWWGQKEKSQSQVSSRIKYPKKYIFHHLLWMA